MNSHWLFILLYISARLHDDFHRDFYQPLISELSLVPAFTVQNGKGVSLQVRQSEEKDFIFMINFTEAEHQITLETTVKDIVTEKELAGEITPAKYEVKIVEKIKVH
ncbi:Beta-galactosidase C-terminal domain [Domibacillus sp. DTU_2020_1001157_1_SI_ALB_TIR_016]|uniref:Beta-galactosidase C-terminal domain n=1 Tax=Domibacillus sp. DTU_2020_1001157_1_SI_ALB_TIR_016 TaxID=3077789 RepID=UPI0028E19DD6|nr:Beta-galactosidase C-terminal domain [Domibacillus sp. DTU_2020_1001157_1_SI_ALB_TIR_016]WNS78053.1 Beta-galactosidase C-terminal domain [Domibacillus sp. DTU_2020_1001157_1_SI_ALB_TIR_016]